MEISSESQLKLIVFSLVSLHSFEKSRKIWRRTVYFTKCGNSDNNQLLVAVLQLFRWFYNIEINDNHLYVDFLQVFVSAWIRSGVSYCSYRMIFDQVIWFQFTSIFCMKRKFVLDTNEKSCEKLIFLLLWSDRKHWKALNKWSLRAKAATVGQTNSN